MTSRDLLTLLSNCLIESGFEIDRFDPDHQRLVVITDDEAFSVELHPEGFVDREVTDDRYD